MAKIPLCVIGCGGMGHRHILAYRELENSGIGNIEIVAVCDLNPKNADLGAREVERLFGKKPMVFTDLDKMLARSDIAAVDVVTDPAYHHAVAIPALKAGKHAIVEKPLGLTVRACQAMIAAARENKVVLATAENLRRDPPNRLARSVLDHGLLDVPYLMIHNALGGDDQIIITPWRHLKDKGAIGLDMAVHYTDIVQYYMGDFDQIYGCGLIVEPIRRKPDNHGLDLESYRERYKTFPDQLQATGEDSVLAMYKMKSGAWVQFSYVGAGRGSGEFERSVHGRKAAMWAPGDRNGRPVSLRLGRGKELQGADILSLLPNFQMTEITNRLFDQKVVYELPFPPIDAKHMAIEFHDFGEAVLKGGTPEVDGHLGMTAVAAILGAYESAVAGRAVSMEEILSGKVRAYQEDIDVALGL
ncbi:MAG: Gfo/Idh/MocA family oxidoreductase [Candidatus Handelsmanbacteria bacterium]|nr:Gfo/Idh/MocA family oxidoreductase [Candidatus Handelsmanbacteria bacterium]